MPPNAPHNDYFREQPIDRFYREQDERWERERVAPVDDDPRSHVERLADEVPVRLAQITAELETAVQRLADRDEGYEAERIVRKCVHDLRNIQNGVLALCECVSPQKESR